MLTRGLNKYNRLMLTANKSANLRTCETAIKIIK